MSSKLRRRSGPLYALVGVVIVLTLTAAALVLASTKQSVSSGSRVADLQESLAAAQTTDRGDVAVPDTIYSAPESLNGKPVVLISPIGHVDTTFRSKDAVELMKQQEIFSLLESGLENGLADVTR